MQDEQKEGGFVMLVFLAVAILTPSIAALPAPAGMRE